MEVPRRKFSNAKVQAIFNCFPVFAIKKIYFAVFQATHKAHNENMKKIREKCWLNFLVLTRDWLYKSNLWLRH